MKTVFSTFLFLTLFSVTAKAQDSESDASSESIDYSDTASLLDIQTFKAPRPLGHYIGRNEDDGTTLFVGRSLPIMMLLYKKGIWFYSKRSGRDPIRLMNLKSIEKYRGKRPRLKNFVFIGYETFAVAEYRRKGYRYVMLQKLNLTTGRLVDKPKVMIKQKVRGLKYHNEFEYNFLPTPNGTKVGIIFEQTRKTSREKGDKKYILIDEDLNKLGRRSLKRKTKSAANRKEKISNKKANGYHILNDGTLYTDVSENFRTEKELSLDGISLLIYPLDTNYVVNVKLEDEVNEDEESQVGGLSWWHTDTTYSTLGVKYTVVQNDKDEKTLKQELVLNNNLDLDTKENNWIKLEYPLGGIEESIDINSYVIDNERIAVINHFKTEIVLIVNSDGTTTRRTRYKLTNTNVLAFEDDGTIKWTRPIQLEYPEYTYNLNYNPFVIFRKNDQLYFVRHERTYYGIMIIPKESFYETYRLKLKTGEVKYEKKDVPFRVAAINNTSDKLNEHTVSAHRRRLFQIFHSKKVYEFSVR